MAGIIKATKKRMPSEHRQAFYQDVINVLWDEDWDTQDECRGMDKPHYDKALDAVFDKHYGKGWRDE